MAEAVVRRCSSKWLFLKISQISQQKAVLESLFNNPLSLQIHRKTTALEYLFNKPLELQLYKNRL